MTQRRELVFEASGEPADEAEAAGRCVREVGAERLGFVRARIEGSAVIVEREDEIGAVESHDNDDAGGRPAVPDDVPGDFVEDQLDLIAACG